MRLVFQHLLWMRQFLCGAWLFILLSPAKAVTIDLIASEYGTEFTLSSAICIYFTASIRQDRCVFHGRSLKATRRNSDSLYTGTMGADTV